MKMNNFLNIHRFVFFTRSLVSLSIALFFSSCANETKSYPSPFNVEGSEMADGNESLKRTSVELLMLNEDLTVSTLMLKYGKGLGRVDGLGVDGYLYPGEAGSAYLFEIESNKLNPFSDDEVDFMDQRITGVYFYPSINDLGQAEGIERLK